MSFVGPRPDVTFTVDMYDEYDKQRLAVMPGLTGLWQVSGRKQVSFKEMIRRDIEYIEKQSLALDLKILFLTIGTVLRREGS
jgi:lipopolysaccharide/colanic/teichoic acid biosynthesis glycosyltransferase